MSEEFAITGKQLILDMRKLGLVEGQTVMVHASMKSLGPVVGGPQTILDSLLEVLTPNGTLMMLAGWADNPYDYFGVSFQEKIEDWTEEKRQEFYEKSPAFDRDHSRADTRKMGILAEYLRTYPGAIRSRHPLGYVAVGRLAHYVLKDQRWQYREGVGSPLEKLCQVEGKVLLLGAPTGTVTLLHHSENLANIANKKNIRYKMPLYQEGERVWKDFEEYDFMNGIAPWPEDYFKVIVDNYIGEGLGKQGTVGQAECHLFDAKDLLHYGVAWMERNLQNINTQQD